jgi:hypothetical protein
MTKFERSTKSAEGGSRAEYLFWNHGTQSLVRVELGTARIHDLAMTRSSAIGSDLRKDLEKREKPIREHEL